jgi:hypothetical protein
MTGISRKTFKSVEDAVKREGAEKALDLLNRGYYDREYRKTRNEDVKHTLAWAREELKKRGSDETLRKAK